MISFCIDSKFFSVVVVIEAPIPLRQLFLHEGPAAYCTSNVDCTYYVLPT